MAYRDIYAHGRALRVFDTGEIVRLGFVNRRGRHFSSKAIGS